jgi:hypothetical protein
VRVLLIEEGWSQTGYLARELTAAGVDVSVLTANGSAWNHRRHGVPWSSAAPLASPAFLAQLDARVRAAAFDHVVPLTESAMARLWDAAPAPAWAERIYPRTEAWQRRLVRDKHLLVEHMAARGVAVPRQLRLDQSLTAAAAIRALGLPMVVKPATGYAGVGVDIVDSHAALVRALDGARAAGGDWAVQEHIDGPTCLVGGLFHAGRALRLHAAEKLEQFPARTGPAIRLRSDGDAALAAFGTRVFEELRWTGIASADVIRRRDGTHVLLEVNPRPWASIAQARAAGVDLFRPFAALLAGRVPAPDLAFAAGRESLVFPRYLLSPAYHSLAGLARGVRDLLGDAGLDWRHPRLAFHNLLRMHGLRRQWRGP